MSRKAFQKNKKQKKKAKKKKTERIDEDEPNRNITLELSPELGELILVMLNKLRFYAHF